MHIGSRCYIRHLENSLAENGTVSFCTGCIFLTDTGTVNLFGLNILFFRTI